MNRKLDEFLIDPRDGSPFGFIEEDAVFFQSGNSYRVVDGTPVLIDESESIFELGDIATRAPRTQDSSYRDRSLYKNWFRQKWLPALSSDTGARERIVELSNFAVGKRILVIGAGDKSDVYRNRFSQSDVVISDVHLQFGVDYVLDAHQIPFKESTFTLVIASQVLEHTVNPWVVAKEFERVTETGGRILVEVPFAFPYHSAPFDFYRFTPSALRFLFSNSKIVKLETPGGLWSAAAVSISQAVVDSFKNRYFRMAALAVTRLALGWMKHLDFLTRGNALNFPKGFSVLYQKEAVSKDQRELLAEVVKLIV